MASKRLISPPPFNIMQEIFRIIAEPNSVTKKKKLNVTYFRHPGKVHNHDYCDACSEGGQIVCCDRCPSSYHIRCHIPPLIKLPDGEWLCRKCCEGEPKPEVPTRMVDKTENFSLPRQYDYVGKDRFEVDMLPSLVNKIIGKSDSPKCVIFTDMKSSLRKLFNFESPRFEPTHSLPADVTLVRRCNVRVASRKQLDKQKMIRKSDKCCLCKRGVLRGRLIQCGFCSRLYHLNCLDPPTRGWDHTTRWICPAHDNFYELAYPKLYDQNDKLRLSKNIVVHKSQYDTPKLPPVHQFVNIPSHIDAMYKKSEEIIPKTTQNSSLNILCDVATLALESINSNYKTEEDNVSNDISAQFLEHQRLNKLQKNNCSLPSQPTASLSCLSLPNMTFSIQNKSFTIGKSPDCDLCLLTCGNCENVSDYHATITFDEKLGDYLVKSHSKHGIIVDNVSYLGNYRPKDLSVNELKKINTQIKKHINRRRNFVRKRRLFCLYHDVDSERMFVRYVGKRWRSTFDPRPIYKYYIKTLKKPKHNHQNIIQCKCSQRVIPKDGYAGQAVLYNESIMSVGCIKFKLTIKEVPQIIKEEPRLIRNGIIVKEPLNGTRIKTSQSEQKTSIDVVHETGKNSLLVNINGHNSLDDANDTNFFNEQNNTNMLDVKKCDNKFPNDNIKINGAPLNDNFLIYDDNDDPMSDTDLSDLHHSPHSKRRKIMNGMSSNTSTYLATDLIQEVEVDANISCSSESFEGNENIEEEVVYEMDSEADTSTVDGVNEGDVQDWITEESVVENYGGTDQEQLISTVGVGYSLPASHRKNCKTENFYAPSSLDENVQTDYDDTYYVDDDASDVDCNTSDVDDYASDGEDNTYDVDDNASDVDDNVHDDDDNVHDVDDSVDDVDEVVCDVDDVYDVDDNSYDDNNVYDVDANIYRIDPDVITIDDSDDD